jgi:hypothetical protein
MLIDLLMGESVHLFFIEDHSVLKPDLKKRLRWCHDVIDVYVRLEISCF